jgi:hypothetical protein
MYSNQQTTPSAPISGPNGWPIVLLDTREEVDAEIHASIEKVGHNRVGIEA